MPALRSRNCGMVLYLSNSACQAAASSGGTTPVTGFHSTIESPDSVRRVAPPTTSVANMSAATMRSHTRMARWEACGSDCGLGCGECMITVLARNGADHIDAQAYACNAATMPIRLRKLIG